MTMRQLAIRVGVKPGSLYHHVPSKQDLLLDVLLNIVSKRREAWASQTLPKGLEEYLRFLISRQRSHPAEEICLRHESRHLTSKQRIWLSDALGQLYLPLRQAIIAQCHCADTQEVDGTIQTILNLVDTAHSLRCTAHQADEGWIEAWVLRLSTALFNTTESFFRSGSVSIRCTTHCKRRQGRKIQN